MSSNWLGSPNPIIVHPDFKASFFVTIIGDLQSHSYLNVFGWFPSAPSACCARPQGPIWCPTGVYRGPIFGTAQVGAGNGEADTMRIACGTASAIDHPGEREKGASDVRSCVNR